MRLICSSARGPGSGGLGALPLAAALASRAAASPGSRPARGQPGAPRQTPPRTHGQNACESWPGCRGRGNGCRQCNERPASRRSPAQSCGWSNSRWHSRRSTTTAITPGDTRYSPCRHRPAPGRPDPDFPPPRPRNAPGAPRAATPAPKGATKSRCRGQSGGTCSSSPALSVAPAILPDPGRPVRA